MSKLRNLNDIQWCHTLAKYDFIPKYWTSLSIEMWLVGPQWNTNLKSHNNLDFVEITHIWGWIRANFLRNLWILSVYKRKTHLSLRVSKTFAHNLLLWERCLSPWIYMNSKHTKKTGNLLQCPFAHKSGLELSKSSLKFFSWPWL